MTTVTILVSSVSPRLHDARERVSLQACPADQSPVNIGFGDERVNIIRGDAAAVKDSHLVGALAIVALENYSAQRAVDRFGLLGGRGAARADRPDRLVGENHARDRVVADAFESALQLSQHHVERAS